MVELEMENKLPDKIRIGGTDYTVACVQGLRDGHDELNGHIKYNACEILIDADMTEHKQWVTTWHEVLHGLLEHAGIDEQDERIVLVLGYGITQVLRDNKYLRSVI